ncbi:MAG: formylglycine-generating enzyme family protein [Planctomycetota bacterium]
MPRSAETDLSLDETVLVPAGPFLFGEDQELRYLPPFRIGRYPVTVCAYSRFVVETGHFLPEGWETRAGPPDRQDHPVTGVSFLDALTYARWAGRRLPTEEQWEKAARGTDGRLYPWGRKFNVRRLNSRAAKKRDTTPVTAYPEGASPFGVVDLAGNAWEWTSTWYDLEGDLKVLKGGCHALTKEYAKASYRHFNDPRFANSTTGFRTVEPL